MSLRKGHILMKGYERFFEEVKRGGSDEENDHVGNSLNDAVCLYRRMLGAVAWRWQRWRT